MFSTPSAPTPTPPESPIPQYNTNLLDNDTHLKHHPKQLTIGSINVQGGLAHGFFHSLCEQAELHGIDIFGVQETNASPQKTKSLLFQDNHSFLKYQALWASHKTKYRGSGVGLLIHNHWFKYKIESAQDPNGRGLTVRFGFKSAAHFAIIVCYLPNKAQQPTIYNTTEQWIQQQIDNYTQQGCHILLLGDFNGVVNPAVDRANEKHVTNLPELKLFRWLSSNSYIDTYRTLNPTQQLFTWNDQSRIDMIWSDPTLGSYLRSTSFFPLVAPTSSDHIFITATFSIYTLIRPSPAATRGTFDRRERKICHEDATDEQWEAFASRVDHVLCRHGNLTALQIPMVPPDAGPTPEPDWDALQNCDPATTPIDELWHVLEDTIISAAKYTLPKKWVGGPPKAPHGANRLRARTADIGRAIRRVEDILIDSQAPADIRAAVYADLLKWNTTNTADHNLPSLPSMDSNSEQWSEWTAAARISWKKSRATHAAFSSGKTHTSAILSAIDRRNLRFHEKPRTTIRSILEVQSSRVHLDHIITKDSEDRDVILDDPQEIKDATLRYFRDVWHAPRNVGDLDDTWAPFYAPRGDIDPAWFDHLMSPPTKEETLSAIASAPNNKAPGRSGLTNDLLKRLGPLAQSLIHLVFGACLVQTTVPNSWLRGMLYCIPKGPCWSGRLEDVRPLTLLEHGRKILFSILIDRLVAILTSHRILSGTNFSVLPGTMTKDPIHILNAVMEDAREHNQEAWILFQDIRRCFDSVSCHPGQTLARSLERLRIPSDFIRLCTTIALNKTNVVITAFGLTEPYKPGCGLDQGGVECPLM